MLASCSVKWIKKHLLSKRLYLFGLSLVVALVGSGLSYLQITYTHVTGDRQNHDIILPAGSSLNTIADLLHRARIIDHPQSFIWNARLRGFYRFIQAGEYRLPKHRTLKSILTLLVSGKTIVHKFVIVEGQTTKDVLTQLFTSNRFVGDLSIIPDEGSLYPETYYYSHGMHRQTFILKVQQSMQKHITKLWQQRSSNIMLTSPKKALILASIIEKETSLVSEKEHVAGLFYNRLRTGMKLQSDPTVSYGLYASTNRPLNQALSRAELAISTPYNTYIHLGLPPTPICNPSLTSLKAVFYPLTTADFYFVADGTGGHIFSTNYPDHQRHHQSLRQRRAKIVKDNESIEKND